MLPSLGSPSMNHLPSIAGAGLLIFVPWYLLRDKRIDLDEIVDQKRMLGSASQLDEWLEKTHEGLGISTLCAMFRLYVYIECCLKRRYPEKTAGEISKIDSAMASIFQPTRCWVSRLDWTRGKPCEKLGWR